MQGLKDTEKRLFPWWSELFLGFQMQCHLLRTLKIDNQIKLQGKADMRVHSLS